MVNLYVIFYRCDDSGISNIGGSNNGQMSGMMVTKNGDFIVTDLAHSQVSYDFMITLNISNAYCISFIWWVGDINIR